MAAIALVACPYDSVHRVKQSRLQLHITKCRMNHLHEPKFICPFNATHVFPVQERDYHLLNCEHKHPLDRLLSNPVEITGRLAVPSYSEASLPPDNEESWDDEITNGPAYVPPKEAPLGAIVLPPQEYQPAMRRQYYKELHTKPLNDNDHRPGQRMNVTQPATRKEATQRIPQETSMVELQNRQVSGLGLGRGRGIAPANGPGPRIAANIFSAVPSVVTNGTPPGFPPLGMGRGAAMHQPSPVFNDGDFPALGFGRGVSRK